jgi:hypothetical protein
MRVRNQWFKLMAPEDDKGGEGGTGDAGSADAGTDANEDQGGNRSPDTGAGKGDQGGKDVKSTWPEDWRTQIAGTDEGLNKRLSRYSSPKDIANALLSVQNRISAGELRSTLPKNATEDQIKVWREENGIPEAPDKYDLKLAEGLKVESDDKPLIDKLMASMHKVNAPAAIASEVVNFYYQYKAEEIEARGAKDKDAARQASDALHAEWGTEFRPNMNMIEGLLDTAPAGVKDLIKFGRLSDGTPIMANPDAIRWLNNMAREINPVTTVVPNAGANISGAIDDEIAKIEKTMRNDRKAYNADDKMQARYRDLLNARERAGKKAA